MDKEIDIVKSNEKSGKTTIQFDSFWFGQLAATSIRNIGNVAMWPLWYWDMLRASRMQGRDRTRGCRRGSDQGAGALSSVPMKFEEYQCHDR